MLRCFTHPTYYYPLPEGHPFPMAKFPESAALLDSEGRGLLRVELCAAARMEDLLRVHTPEYLDSIASGALAREEQVRLGLPLRPELLARSAREVGGTLAALEAAWDDGFGCNLAGGTHHAFADRGLGYCVLNDVAVAIRKLHDTQPTARVFVLDTDAHQGNGTHGIFAKEQRVFTYSLHVARNYPADKTPGSLDVGLERYAPSAEYFRALMGTVPDALLGFRPDVVFWIAGADPHRDDRFGQMMLSDEDFAARDEALLDLLEQLGVPVVVVYGGGYNRTDGHTAWIHAATVMRVARRMRG
jgi:acetoin utilization deacetylase AcuC-like enzyme